MKAPVLVSVVVLLHAMALGTLMFMQGCGTVQPKVEPGPAPVVMPPPVMPETSVAPLRSTELKPAKPEGPAAALPVVPAAPAVTTYVIQKGDSISKIAHKHGLSTRELAEANGIKDLNKIRIGQKLNIPSYGGAAAPAVEKSAEKSAEKKAGKGGAKAPKAAAVAGANEYIVVAGDSLGKIAVKHGVKVAALREANSLKNDNIRTGQKLVIPTDAAAKSTPSKKTGKKTAEAAAPAPAPVPVPEVAPVPVPAPAIETPMAPAPALESAPAPAPAGATPTLSSAHQPIKYPVSTGETVESIAKAFLVSPDAILKLNNLPAGATLKPGQTILIPVPE